MESGKDSEMNPLNCSSVRMLTVLQICDSAFPTGGFSHSMGFESAHKHKFVTDKASLRRFVIACLENMATKMLPFVRESHESIDQLNSIVELDEICQTCLTNHVENRASRRQGRALLDTANEAFGESLGLGDLRSAVLNGRMNGHLPVIFGAMCALLSIGQKSACNMFMYNCLKTIMASSVRLGFIGTLQAQGMQFDLQKIIPEIIERNNHINIGEVHLSFPAVDVLQNLHDTMFSKLFYS